MLKNILFIGTILVLHSFAILFAQTRDAVTLVDLEFQEISEIKYQEYALAYNHAIGKAMFLDSNGYISKFDLKMVCACDQTCESYFLEIETGKKMGLPSGYDAGILGLSFTPSGQHFLIFSAYDSPDFKNYYAARSELFVYKMGEGIDDIERSLSYFSQEWSIEAVVWIDEKSIALKIYTEARWGDGSGVTYKYVKTRFE